MLPKRRFERPTSLHVHPPTGSSTEHVFTYIYMYMGYACFQEKYYRVCIARAAVNESVCEDSYTEHVQFATAAVSTPFRT